MKRDPLWAHSDGKANFVKFKLKIYFSIQNEGIRTVRVLQEVK